MLLYPISNGNVHDGCCYGSCGHVFNNESLLYLNQNRNEQAKCAKCKRLIYYFIPYNSVIDPVNHGLNILILQDKVPVGLVRYNSIFSNKNQMSLLEKIRQNCYWSTFLRWPYKLIIFILFIFTIGYIFIEDDFIPDETPVIGYFDDIGIFFILLIFIYILNKYKGVLKDIDPDQTGELILTNL